MRGLGGLGYSGAYIWMEKKVLKKLAFVCAGAMVLLTSAQAAVEYNLAYDGAMEIVNGAIYMQWDEPEPMGTGVIDAFVAIKGTTSSFQHGYNTDGAVEFDTLSGGHTHALLLSDIPIVTLGGIDYREFLLDINQDVNHHILSLDKLKIHMASVGNLTGYLTNPDFGAPIYDLDEGGDNYIKLDDSFGAGSGKGDMLLFVPDSLFAGAGNYIYLYSMCGDTIDGSDGFEEWAVGKGGSIIPEPATIALLCLGGLLLRKRTA
jgi:hypothetical protein